MKYFVKFLRTTILNIGKLCITINYVQLCTVQTIPWLWIFQFYMMDIEDLICWKKYFKPSVSCLAGVLDILNEDIF